MCKTPTGSPSLGAVVVAPTVGWSPDADVVVGVFDVVVVGDDEGFCPTWCSSASNLWRRTAWLWDSAMPVPHSW